MELLIGAGSARDKRVFTQGKERWEDLITLDNNPHHKPEVLWDLTRLPLPFEDNQFDEIHAYEVLEHTGAQGDYRFFFAQFSEFWRILKPDGKLFGSCPHWKSVWAWGDPSHTRVIQKEQFMFLSQQEYKNQIGKTPMSDFRYIYQADFETEMAQETEDHLLFALRAVKPSRIREST
jgi:SAM-dependent methyltransferase